MKMPLNHATCRHGPSPAPVSRRPGPRGAALFLTTFLAAVAFEAVLSPSLAARGRADKAVVDAPRPFGFRNLEIFKTEGSVGAVHAVDIDRDGLTDLVFANNSEGTVRFLMQQRPGEAAAANTASDDTVNEVTSDPRFRVEKFFTEKHVTSLVVGEFNGDDKPDIAYYTDPPELEVVYQTDIWGKSRDRFPIRDATKSLYALNTRDLNGDGKLDLTLLGEGKLHVLYQRPEGGFRPPLELYHTPEKVIAVDTVDVNDDGRPDLVYLAPSAETPATVRLQGKEGFGAEISSPLRALQAWMTTPFSVRPESSPRPMLLTIQDGSYRLKFYEWQEQPVKSGLADPHWVALRADADPKKLRHLFTDVNHDGRTDLLISYPETAQVEVHFQDAQGVLSGTGVYPTLAEVNSVAACDLDGDGAVEVLVSSEKEKAIGVSRWKDGRLQIPESWPLETGPLLVQSAPPGTGGRGETVRAPSQGGGGAARDGDERAEPATTPAAHIYVVARGKERGFQLSVLTLEPEGKSNVVLEKDLGLQGSAPSSMRLVDADADGAMDLLLFVPYEDPYLLRQILVDGVPSFVDISRQRNFGIGQLSKLDPSAVTLHPGRQGDPAQTFLVAAGTYVRLLGLDSRGRLQVLEQFSGRSTAARLTAATLLQLDDDPEREVVMLDSAASSLEILQREENGGYRLADSLKIPRLDLVAMEALDMDTDGKQDLVVVGKNKIGILYARSAQAGFQQALSYSLEDKKFGTPEDLTVGDLNADGILDVIVSTNRRHNLVFLELKRQEKPGAAAALAHALAFPIFEEKSYMRRKASYGPRQMLITDVDGDGLDDLLLLIHDRILLYLQDSIDA